MKLVRQENSFTGFWSPDGSTWTQLGAPVRINMAATVYVGLVSSSHNNAVASASVFDHVSVTSMPSTGVYRLSTRGQPGLSLDVEGFGNADGTAVSLYYANHTSNQQWLVEGQGDGTYKIYAYSGQNSLQMLDDSAGGIANGNAVTTYEDNNTSAQRWIFLPVGAGYWRIVPENGAGTNQTLDIQNGNNEGVGSRTDIYTYGGDDQWMRDFMSGAAQRGYRVDYVTIHWYGGDDPAGFLNYVDYIHNLYNKPVWITEFAPADWSGQHGISAQQAADFMRQVIPQLNQRSYVQRYSWFSASTGDAALGQSALFNNDRSLTDLGKLYARM